MDKTYRFRLYNIVIQPVGKQSKGNYEWLFRKMFEKNQPVKVYRDFCLKFKSMDHSDGLISGQLVRFVLLDGKDWYNSETNEIENVDVDPALHPNVKLAEYAFSPTHHRMAVSSELSVNLVLKFLEASIAKALDGSGMEAKVNVIASSESVEQIRSAKDVTKLIIELSYSNGDNDDEWCGLIDADMKDSDVRNLKLEATATRGNPMDIAKSNILSGALQLSRQNGTATATAYDKNRRRRVISTKSFPEERSVKPADEKDLLKKLKDIFKSFA